LECLERLHETAQKYQINFVRGNHEDYVLDYVRNPQRELSVPLQLYYAPAEWTAGVIPKAILDEIALWPQEFVLSEPEGLIHFTHASVHSNADGINANLTMEQMSEKVNPEADIFVTSHTHVPFKLQHDRMVVVNTGSVGRPLDGNLAASYIWIEYMPTAGRWNCEIIRVPFAVDAILKELARPHFRDACGPFHELLFKEHQTGQGMFPVWRRKFLQEYLSGGISAAESIRQLIEHRSL
jgi:predicted phosphodiesterase